MPRKPDITKDRYSDPFPSRLRELMRNNHTNQTEIAGVLNLKNRQSVTGYTDGSTLPTIDKVVLLARYFNVSADYLLGLSEAPSADPKIQEICRYTGLTEETIAVLHQTPSIGKSFSEIIPEYGFNISFSLDQLGDAILFARVQHEKMKPTINENHDNVISYFGQYKSMVENIELALFRLNRALSEILDLYKGNDVIKELNRFVFDSLEADDEQD